MCKIIKFQTKEDKKKEQLDKKYDYMLIKNTIEKLEFDIELATGYTELYKEENGEEKYKQSLEEIQEMKELLEFLKDRAEIIESTMNI